MQVEPDHRDRRGRASWRAALAGGVVGLTLSPLPAMAYIDPGTGHALLQGLIAAAVGAAWYVGGPLRALGGRLRRWLRRRR